MAKVMVMKLLIILLALFVSGFVLTPRDTACRALLFKKHIPLFYGSTFYPKLQDATSTPVVERKRSCSTQADTLLFNQREPFGN